MAVIQMPGRKGENETGMITRWHKKTGDWVAEGDELFSFDTDEGTFTVKSQKAGRLVAVFVPEGEIVNRPADVGMLTTPSPDSVLKIGRQQFIDETKPAEARQPEVPVQEEEEPAEDEMVQEEIGEEPIEPEEETEQEEIAEEIEEEAAPEEDAALSEEELLEYVEEDLTELEVFEAADEADVQTEAEEEEEPIVSEEELLQYVEEETDELDALDPEEEDDWEEAAEDEVCDEAEQEAAEEEEAVKEALPAAKPASVTAQADMTLCMDIAARTGVSMGAMVRFAAMHTALGAYLKPPVECCGLRALNELEKQENVCDLSGSGVTAIMRTAEAGEVTLLVPAVQEAWRVNNDALEVYPCLNLTLAFDESVLAVEEAAAGLKETCEKLENLIELLI